MRDAAFSGADPGSLSEGYRAQAQMEPSVLDLDGGQGRQSTCPQNMVQPSAKGSRERRDTSRRECRNALLRNANPHFGSDEDEHDDRDEY